METTTSTSNKFNYDVIIVGSGLTGLSSAVVVGEADLKVCILEKNPYTGGNSVKASSGMSSVKSISQELQGIKDSPEQLYNDIIKAGQGFASPQHAKVLSDKAQDALIFIDKIFQYSNNQKQTLTAISQTGGHSVARTHRPAPGPPGSKPTSAGFAIISALKSKLQTLKNVEILTSASVKELVKDSSGKVTKAIVSMKVGDENISNTTFTAKSIILATGGWGADFSDQGLLKKYTPKLLSLGTTNQPGSTGDGIILGQQVGAAVVQMDRIQVHPTGFVDIDNAAQKNKFLAPEALRGYGGVLINPEGHRFVNELTTRDKVTESIQNLKSKFPQVEYNAALLLINDKIVQKFNPQIFGFYKFKKLFRTFSSIEEVASFYKIFPGTLHATMKTYNNNIKTNTNDPFGKTVFPESWDDFETGNYHVAMITPSIHYCMGGLKFDTQCHVLDTNGDIIPGLYAAGEVTGGVHGVRLAGNSLLDCVVFGRIAGESVIESIAKSNLLEEEDGDVHEL